MLVVDLSGGLARVPLADDRYSRNQRCKRSQFVGAEMKIEGRALSV
jgi:hypothetical protein